MNKKIAALILVAIFTIFSILFGKDYLDFQNNSPSKKDAEIEKQVKNFDISKINLIENVEIFRTPNLELLEDFIEKIKNAKKNIYIEVYMFTEKRILQALKEAKNKWIEIKVVLERNPYLSENINNKTFDELKNAWIEVNWSKQKNYNLNHSKLFIIDDLAIISTWNLTYSIFSTNRDFLVFTEDKRIVETLKKIFETDFKWEKKDFYNENLVISPNISREKLEKLLLSAEKNIKIYIQYLKDKKINDLLKNLKQKNIDIEIIVDKSAIENEETKDLQKSGINIKAFNWKKMHSKVILVDEKYVFVWSVNFSEYSLDKNREMWIILKNEGIVKRILEIFKNDFIEASNNWQN